MKADTRWVSDLDLNIARRNAIGDGLRRVASVFPDRVAVTDGESEYTYRSLEADADAVARGLLKLRTAPEKGEPVAMLMSNSYEFLVMYFGIVKAGLVAMPLNHGLAPKDIGWMLSDSCCRIVAVDRELLPLLAEANATDGDISALIINETDASDSSARSGLSTEPAEVRRLSDLKATESDGELRVLIEDWDAAQCLYTSGTTSRPKGALTSHSAVVTAAMTNALLTGHRWGSDHDSLLSLLPLFHVTALNTLVMPTLFTGGTVHLVAPFDPAAVLDLMESRKITVFMGLPMMYMALIGETGQRPRNLSHVRKAIYGMAQLPESALDSIQKMMPNADVVLGSGQTEVMPATVMQWGEHRVSKPASWGPPVPTVEVSIMDPMGTLLPRGETGEIVYRGPHVTLGYWNRSDANAEAFAHGWFHSGDIGHMDDEGVVWFTDRAKDIIKTGGENVSSIKVERVVIEAPGVLECTVIGTPDEHWGEAVTAVVVTDRLPERDESGGDEHSALRKQIADDIIAFARERLAGFETPKSVRFVEEFPRTSTGKIRKNILRG